MSVRRLAAEQPDSFAFDAANDQWADKIIARYPEGRQQSAVIPLLWKGQEQEGWVTRPMIETIAGRLGMAPIRVLEVATFYSMFHLAPVGRTHIQVCGTTPCMLRGAEALVDVCKRRIAGRAKEVSADGQFSWEEVECLGACVNAPMVQVFKDYYEDLTPESFEAMIDAFARGETPTPGPQNDRFASEPEGGALTLEAFVTGDGADAQANATTALWRDDRGAASKPEPVRKVDAPPADGAPPSTEPHSADELAEDDAERKGRPERGAPADAAEADDSAVDDAWKPETLTAARDGSADDLKRIKGVGPKMEELVNGLGFWHFDQIAAWTAENVAWVDANLQGFRGRIERDDWVGQARTLAAGGETEFAKRVDAGEVKSSLADDDPRKAEE